MKVLYVSHNHPTVRPGGAEAYAFELYETLRDTGGEIEPVFLARSGKPVSPMDRYHEGTLLTPVDEGRDPNQYFFYTDVLDYDWTFGRSPNKGTLTRFFRDFLLAQKPDVVHFQHSLFFGYDILRVTRNTLPGVPILYTLHEFLPICNRNGQMVRTGTNELCTHSSPRRCHECFPDISPPEFFLRKRFAQSHFEDVDMFLAPSQFLLERYVDWGIPREKIRFEDYGRKPVEQVVVPEPEGRPRNRLGYIGQLSFFKGVNVLLKAIKLLAEEGTDAQLWVYGANLDLQPQDFVDEFNGLLEDTRDHVTFAGGYVHDELPKLMAGFDWLVVPSIWWENSPLVIQEAFQHSRPVISSDIGGMAEKVADGVDGLHFRVRDPISLADTIRTAITTPGLWERLHGGIRQIYPMDEHISSLTGIYHELLQRPRTVEALAAPVEA